MPEKDGAEVIMDITKEFPQAKIIAISGGGNINDVDFLELAHNLGAVKTFQKPFSLDEFKAAVEEILQ
jgi:DNA-binding NtrC family response regulator